MQGGKQQSTYSAATAGQVVPVGGVSFEVAETHGNSKTLEFVKLIVKESVVMIWTIVGLITVIIVLFVIIDKVQDISIQSQSKLIMADVKRHITAFLKEKTQIVKSTSYLMSTGQMNFVDQTRHPIWSEVLYRPSGYDVGGVAQRGRAL